MRFNGLDLNLLVALDALISEQSVSEAAHRIGLTQSAMSSALGRLREYFGDNLLVNVGRRMVLTPRGEQLAGPVHDTLLQISTMIARPAEFEAQGSTRCFTILASDYMIRSVLARVLAKVGAIAPGVSFMIHALEDHPSSRIERAEVDLLLTAEQFISPDHPHQILFEDDYVVLGWADNPALDKDMDVETYCRLHHVEVSHGKNRNPSLESTLVKAAGHSRIVDVTVPAFTDVGDVLINTARISTVHRRLAEIMCRELPLVMREMPFPLSVKLAAQWHHINRTDTELSWFLGLLQAECDAQAPCERIAA